EGDQVQTAGQGECSQVSVIPDVRRKRSSMCEGAPMLFESGGFVNRRNARIAQENIVFLPGIRQGQCMLAEDASIGCQPQESELRESAKIADGVVRQTVKPRFRRRMMEV